MAQSRGVGKYPSRADRAIGIVHASTKNLAAEALRELVLRGRQATLGRRAGAEAMILRRGKDLIFEKAAQ